MFDCNYFFLNELVYPGQNYSMLRDNALKMLRLNRFPISKDNETAPLESCTLMHKDEEKLRGQVIIWDRPEDISPEEWKQIDPQDKTRNIDVSDPAFWPASKKQEIDALPACEFIYSLSPRDYFIIFDAPLLVQLNNAYFECRETVDTITEGHISSDFWGGLFEAITTNERYKTKQCRFGVSIHGTSFSKTGYQLRLPRFGKLGRIDAYQRFVADKGREQTLHAARFHIRPSPSLPAIKDNYGVEDAWYYEMCVGVSLTASIASLLAEIKYKKTDKDHQFTWDACASEVFSELLEENRFIAECPAVYWRCAVLRKIISEINSQCIQIEQGTYRLGYHSSDLRIPFPVPVSKDEWKCYATSVFNKLFWKELRSIGVESKNDSTNIQIWTHETYSANNGEIPEYLKSTPAPGSYIHAAVDALSSPRYLSKYDYWRLNDTKAVPPQLGDNSYFRYCRYESGSQIGRLFDLEKRIDERVVNRNDAFQEDTEVFKKEKLRSKNSRVEMEYEDIHRKLYPDMF